MAETKIATRCPQCQKQLRVNPAFLGKSVRCAGCRHVFVVSSLSFPDASETAVSQVAQATLNPAGETGGIAGLGSGPGSGPGKQLGRFELRDVLGRGGFGIVWRAFDPLLNRDVALKVPLFSSQDRQLAPRFLNEARAAAKLRHPNIVPVYESGETDGQLYLAAEFIQGATLAETLKASPPAVEQAVAWVRDLAGALAYAHSQGIVHRDIKPHNVMVAADGRPQIMDFGLAKRLDQDSKMTSDGALLGTPAYMSPEQARGELDRVGPASDQYSLGVVLYELLTGQRPFEGPPAIIVAKVVSEDPPAPRQVRPDIPQDLEAICLKAMDKAPDRRYANLEALAADLTRWLQGEVTQARPLSFVERTRRWARRSPTIARLSLVVAVLLLLGAAATGTGAVVLIRSTRSLEAAIAASREQTQKTAAQAEKLTAATQQAQEKTRQAEAETQRAERAKQDNELALSKLQTEIARRTSAENNLQSTLIEKTRLDQEVARSEREQKELQNRAKEIEQAADKQKWQTYAETLRAIQTDLMAGDFESAEQILAQCDDELRGLEWKYLKSRVRQRSRSLQPRLVSIPDQYDYENLRFRAFSPDGTRVATTGVHHQRRQHFPCILVWQLSKDPELNLTALYELPNEKWIPQLAFSRDGNSVFAIMQEEGLLKRFPIVRDPNRAPDAGIAKWMPPDDLRQQLRNLKNKKQRGTQIYGLPEDISKKIFDAYNSISLDNKSDILFEKDDSKGFYFDINTLDGTRIVSVDEKGFIRFRHTSFSTTLLEIPFRHDSNFHFYKSPHACPPDGSRLIINGVFEKSVQGHKRFINRLCVFDTQ